MGWLTLPPSSTAWQRTCGTKTALLLLHQESTAPSRRQRLWFDTEQGTFRLSLTSDQNQIVSDSGCCYRATDLLLLGTDKIFSQ